MAGTAVVYAIVLLCAVKVRGFNKNDINAVPGKMLCTSLHIAFNIIPLQLLMETMMDDWVWALVCKQSLAKEE